jgi:hypothetical protein
MGHLSTESAYARVEQNIVKSAGHEELGRWNQQATPNTDVLAGPHKVCLRNGRLIHVKLGQKVEPDRVSKRARMGEVHTLIERRVAGPRLFGQVNEV